VFQTAVSIFFLQHGHRINPLTINKERFRMKSVTVADILGVDDSGIVSAFKKRYGGVPFGFKGS
jgi:hypothetical protein